MSTPQEMSTTDQTVVIDQPDTEVVLTAFGCTHGASRARGAASPPSKSKARIIAGGAVTDALKQRAPGRVARVRGVRRPRGLPELA